MFNAEILTYNKFLLMFSFNRRYKIHFVLNVMSFFLPQIFFTFLSNYCVKTI